MKTPAAVLLSVAGLVAALTGAASGDGVRDVMIVDRDGPHVWIALDAMPNAMSVQSSPGRVSLSLSGMTRVQAREIAPARAGPVTAVSIRPTGEGADLVIEGRFLSADAVLRQGGVWIALDGGSLDDAVAATGQGFDQGAAARQVSVSPDPAARVASAGDPAQARASAGAAQAGSAPAQASSAPEAQVTSQPGMSGPCDATAGAVQESPWDLDALTRHGDCLVELGVRDNAAGLYERVLAFDPTHFRAAIGLARIREAQGRGDEAAALYERAANAALTDGEALAARAAAGRNRDEEDR
jgi:hypothetical protein